MGANGHRASQLLFHGLGLGARPTVHPTGNGTGGWVHDGEPNGAPNGEWGGRGDSHDGVPNGAPNGEWDGGGPAPWADGSGRRNFLEAARSGAPNGVTTVTSVYIYIYIGQTLSLPMVWCLQTASDEKGPKICACVRARTCARTPAEVSSKPKI